jgi:hypothetical protein
VGNRLYDAELAQLDYDLTMLRRHLAGAFLNGKAAEISRTRLEIGELERRRNEIDCRPVGRVLMTWLGD